jgi:hypothetical protein
VEDESWRRSHGEDILVAMPVNPHTVHVYWDIDPLKRRLLEDHLDCEWLDIQCVLRVCDVTWILFDGEQANSTRDIPVHQEADNWYVRDLTGGRDYMFLLGVLTRSGDFLALLQTGPVHTPRGPSGTYVQSAMPRVCFQAPPDRSTPVTSYTVDTSVGAAQGLPDVVWQTQFSGYSLHQPEPKAEDRGPLIPHLEG